MQTLKLVLYLRIGFLIDTNPQLQAKPVDIVGKFSSEIVVTDTVNIEYIMSLIKQAIK